MTDEKRMKKSNTRRHFLSLVIGSIGSLFLPAWSFARRHWPVRTVEKNAPVIDKSNWCFKIDGLVENELSFNLEQLKGLPLIIQTRDLDCVERWSVRKLKWQGVQLKTLIEMAKPKLDAKFLTFHCTGGIYSESLTLEQARNDDVILAYAVDSKLLEPKHGAPLRLVVPGLWAYKSAKWVERIEFVAERHLGYWEQRGYDPDAGPKNSYQ
jgi:DMSO/TMAO reductase YedYZ molybdopterin-dependent catalytic subunit